MPTGLTVLLVLAAMSLALFALSHASLHLKLRTRRARPGPTPPISVLKPLKGVDEDLYENLASLARQDYPCFELVLGAEDPCDPALEVARQLRSDFPLLPIQIVAGAQDFGMNPKVTNLVSLGARAKHAHWLVSDSNVRVGPRYLRELASELADPAVGLVHSLIAGTCDSTLGARCENLHLNSFIAPGVAGAERVAGIPTVIGKSMLFRRADLEALGGFARVRDVLAEDYVLGRAFEADGWTVALSPHPVQAVNARWSLSRFVERHLRWGQMRWQISPATFLAEPLLNPTAWLLATIVSSVAHARTLPLAAAMLGFAIELSLVDAAMRALQGRALGIRGAAALVLKDLLVLGLWPLAMVKRTICWRGNSARIGSGSVLRPVHAPLTPRAPEPAEEAA
ncbi:MAG: glycosyltransferase [Deltaproteobacteria bacterium]|nr:glycosyltransferase [Deltaproteobacteria bacterium]